jgi:hypothetical protein
MTDITVTASPAQPTINVDADGNVVIQVDFNPAATAFNADLSVTRDGDSVEIVNTAGTNATIPEATTSLAGVLAALDKVKLNGLPTGLVLALVGNYLQITVGADTFHIRLLSGAAPT